MKKKILGVFVCMLLIAATVLPVAGLDITSVEDAYSFKTEKIDIVNNDSTGTTTTLSYTFSFIQTRFQVLEINKAVYTKINIPGCMAIGKQVGEPAMPVKFIKILLPPMKKVADVKIVGTPVEIELENIDLKESPVFPYQNPVPIGSSKPPEFKKNSEVYSSNELYPSTTFKVQHIGYCRGFSILTVAIQPIQYIPACGQLFYFSEMTLNIDLVNSGYVNGFYRGNSVDKAWVETLVCNPEIAGYYTSGSPTFEYPGGLCNPEDNYDYAIITTNYNGLDYWETNSTVPYNWRSLMNKHAVDDGLDCTLVTIQDINNCSDYWNTTNPLFNDTEAHIREFCKDAYQDWETSYILIGGDDEWIPARHMDYEFESDVDSDIYWSNLDSTFNDDNDGSWGEEGDSGFDLYSELFIGRIPCDEPQDVSNWMTKSFCYADTNDFDYLDNAAFYAGDTGWYCEGDDFIDFSAIKGTDDWLGPEPGAHGQYPTGFGFLHGFETWNEQNPGNEFDLSEKWTSEISNPGWQGGGWWSAVSGLRTAINNDQVTLVSAVAHANYDMSMDISSIEWESEYHNTMPFFVHDYGCHCGDMDAADDGVLHSMLFYSDTELAFACVYNTGFGWGSLEDTNSSSALQQKLFWDYFFDIVNNSRDLANWTLGKAMAYSKDMMAPTINWTYPAAPGSWRGVIQGCLLFGDPVQRLKSPLDPIIYVDDDFDISTPGWGIDHFDNIQDGVDAAVEYGGVYVYNGIYYENVVINKTINLVGEDLECTVIDGGGSGDVIRVFASGDGVGVSVGVSRFTIQNGFRGINLKYSSESTVSGICFVNNNYGIYLYQSSKNILIENTIINNDYGIYIENSSVYNQIYHNNFINNICHAFDKCGNRWNDSYPYCGNYLDDHPNFVDEFYGPGQDIPGSDNIVDTIYQIPCEHSADFYPLMSPWNGTVPLLETVYVDDDFSPSTPGWGYDHFNNVQDGVDAIIYRGTVLVHNGTYFENIVANYKTINLIGEDRDTTVIDGTDLGTVVSVSYAQGFCISGFTLTGNGTNSATAGVSLYKTKNCIVTNNTLINNLYGVQIGGSGVYNSIITSNSIFWNQIGIRISNYGWMWDEKSLGHMLSDNVIYDNEIGISLETICLGFIEEVTISSSAIYGNDIGILFNLSGGSVVKTLVSNCTIEDNRIGIQMFEIREDSWNEIVFNNIYNNWECGLYLNYSKCNLINRNTFFNNPFGIYLVDYSSNNYILGNMLINNDYGIHIEESSVDNGLYHNNFIDNIQNAYDESNNNWDNGYPNGGNYWSDFDEPSEGAYDNNGDGIVDNPYPIPGGSDQDNYPLIRTYGSITNLDTGEVFLRIQHAIDDDDTEDGHTIFVKGSGPSSVVSPFSEEVEIDKSIRLIGTDKPFVVGTIRVGPAESYVMKVIADNVTIDGFAIHNRRNESDAHGIIVLSNYNIISGNIVTENNGHGIYLKGSSNNSITENNMESNNYGICYDRFSNHNKVWKNNFIDNFVQAYDPSGDPELPPEVPHTIGNQWTGNYWSDYPYPDVPPGLCMCPDGRGETPWSIPGGSSEDKRPYVDPYGWNHTYGCGGPVWKSVIEPSGPQPG